LTEDRLDRHIDLINGLVEKLNQIDERIKVIEEWVNRQARYADKVVERMSPEDKAKVEARLKELGLK
jgi:uncharacterized Fe-S cluster-containing protein